MYLYYCRYCFRCFCYIIWNWIYFYCSLYSLRIVSLSKWNNVNFSPFLVVVIFFFAPYTVSLFDYPSLSNSVYSYIVLRFMGMMCEKTGKILFWKRGERIEYALVPFKKKMICKKLKWDEKKIMISILFILWSWEILILAYLFVMHIGENDNNNLWNIFIFFFLFILDSLSVHCARKID